MHGWSSALRGIIPLTLMIACLAEVGCVTLKEPGADELRVPANPTLDVVGSRGPLSQAQAAAVLRRLKLEAPDADMLRVHVAVEQAVAGSPLYTGNSTRLLRDGSETFPAMFAAVRSARRSVYLEYYIFEDVAYDGVHISDLLIAKHAEGVEVALIYDAVGSVATDTALFEKLHAGGVRILAFSPVNPLKKRFRWSINDRDHRKMLVADDHVALLGGINLATTYESAPSHHGKSEPPAGGTAPTYWRDTDLEIRGPAVTELVKLYQAHWLQQGGEALSAAMDTPAPAEGADLVRIIGSSPDAFAPRYYATVLSAINTATRSVWITSAYFVPTHQEKAALAAAAKRGVDVRLLLPSASDSKPSLAVQRSAYSDLLGAGVKIFERDGVILHSKTMVVDGVWSVIGSSNFDHRSVLFNDEVDAVVLGNDAAGAFEEMFRDDLTSAHAIESAAWAHRSFAERVRETFWRVSTTML
jgi:cardiolipin synthase